MAIGHNPAGMWQPKGPISHGMAPGEGQLVYVTGQIAFDENRQVVGKGDVGAQMRRCFEHVERVLASFGGRLADIVSLTVFYTHPSQLDQIRAVWAETFTSAGIAPACIMIQVAGLVDPDLLIELIPVAVIPHDRFTPPA